MASIFDQARNVFKNLQKKATPVNNFIAPITQGVTPQNFVKQYTNQVVNTGNFNPIDTFTKPAAQKFVTDYARGQIMNPIKSGFNEVVQGVRQRNAWNSGMGAAKIAGGVFAATPGGVAFNTGIGGISGGLKGVRKNQPIAPSIYKGMTTPTFLAEEGLGIGEKPIKLGNFDISPFLALGVNFASGNPKGVVKQIGKTKGLVQSLKGVNPQAFSMHPQDLEDIKNAIDILRYTKTAQPSDKQYALKTVQNILDHYVPGHKYSNTKKALDALENIVQTNEQVPKQYRTPFPKVNLVGASDELTDTPILKPQTLDNKIQPIKTEVVDSQKLLQNPQNTGASRSTMNQTISTSLDTDNYIKELTKKQLEAGTVNNGGGIKKKASNFLSEVKAKLVDETSPITDILTSAEKKNKFTTLPKADIRLQIDRVLRSKTLASQFAEDNGLVDAIKKAPDLNALDQYMIAKQARTVAQQGKITGRDLVRDQKLIDDLAPQYEGMAQQVNQYSRKLLDYSVKTGLLDKKLAGDLIKQYPDYVPLNRVFNELEHGSFKGTGKGVASLSKQTVVQKLKGSEREIASPIESLLLKTQDAFSQGERNIAARQLAGYRKLPGFEGLMEEVETGSKAPHTFSFIDKGVKRTFATTPEIEAAAKSLNVEQMGIIGKVLSYPTRALQLGATGLNIPFVVTNMLKDEVTGFINSNKGAKTSILNPSNYVKSLFSAIKHDDTYKEMVRHAGGGTSFDIAREAPNLSIKRLRNPIKYRVTHPQELLRAVENTIGRSEEFGRIKNFKGMRDALVKQGRTLEDANLLAAQAARENTANFARRGSYGRVINWTIPFFNAGIQGSRQLVRSFQKSPVATTAKVATTIFTPIAVTTAWNLSDPERKKIYTDIPSYEKENNIIIIPPEPQQDARGRWNVIKIPLPPGLSNLGTIVRRSMETAEGLDPIRFSEIATNLITAGTSIDVTSPNKLASTFTPQAVKPLVEGATNTNLFTGQKIIPEYMKDRPSELQTKPGVSGVATGIGKVLGVSPLQVENFAQTQLGGLGPQLLGKETAVGNLERRFTKSSGGNLLDKVYDDSDKAATVKSQAKKLLEAGDKEAALDLIRSNKDVLLNASKVKVIRSEVDKYQEYKNKIKADTRLTQEQKDKVLLLIQKKLYELGVVYDSIQ